jgi:hypothetical protein
MQHAFLFVIIPNGSDVRQNGRATVWQDAQHELEQIPSHTGQIEPICQGVWRIPLQNGLSHLSRMIQIVETAGLPYRVLLVDGEPNWLK